LFYWPDAAQPPNKKPLSEAQGKADSPARLSVMESYYPGWRAFVNGREAKLSRAHQGFQSVPVPAGESRVRLLYQPRDFKIGLWFSLASLLAFFSALIFFIAGRGLERD